MRGFQVLPFTTHLSCCRAVAHMAGYGLPMGATVLCPHELHTVQFGECLTVLPQKAPAAKPAQCDLDGRGQAGCEHVGWEVWILHR